MTKKVKKKPPVKKYKLYPDNTPAMKVDTNAKAYAQSQCRKMYRSLDRYHEFDELEMKCSDLTVIASQLGDLYYNGETEQGLRLDYAHMAKVFKMALRDIQDKIVIMETTRDIQGKLMQMGPPYEEKVCDIANKYDAENKCSR